MTSEQRRAHERLQAQLPVRTHERLDVEREKKIAAEKQRRMQANARSMNAKRGKAIRL